MSEEIKIKPCPFCDGKRMRVYKYTESREFGVYCCSCGAKGPKLSFMTDGDPDLELVAEKTWWNDSATKNKSIEHEELINKYSKLESEHKDLLIRFEVVHDDDPGLFDKNKYYKERIECFMNFIKDRVEKSRKELSLIKNDISYLNNKVTEFSVILEAEEENMKQLETYFSKKEG